MNKRKALEEAIGIVCKDHESILKKYEYNSNKYGKNKLELNTSKFLDVISRTEYNLAELGLSASSISKLLKEMFPARKTGNTGMKVCTFILKQVGMKQCARCKNVFYEESFRLNSITSSGLNTYCKTCHMDTVATTQPSRQSAYRAAKLLRIPLWSETKAIKEFYDNCPTGYVVDHIVPLQGTLVSGLHVLSNLQYLTAADNSAKRNKYTI